VRVPAARGLPRVRVGARRPVVASRARALPVGLTVRRGLAASRALARPHGLGRGSRGCSAPHSAVEPGLRRWRPTQLCGCRVQPARRCLSSRARVGLNRHGYALPLRSRCSSWLWSSSFKLGGSHGHSRRRFWAKALSSSCLGRRRWRPQTSHLSLEASSKNLQTTLAMDSLSPGKNQDPACRIEQYWHLDFKVSL
jgi:hypothetical protein